ncbi:MAG TPA: hypothetical protein VFX85_02315, partial [Solirubrobacterales bacterium]|nr:hypothetical protein [Solirubrobacterales bacterium]
PEDPGTNPTPTPENKPAPKSDPAPSPAPAAKPSLKSFGKRLAVSKKGVVKVSKVSCPSGGGACKVTAPKRVSVKIAGEKFWGQVLAPKQLAAGKSEVVGLQLSAAAVELLDGGRLAVTVPVRVVNAGGEVRG